MVLWYCAILLLSTCISAQGNSTLPPLPVWALNRSFSISRTGPMARYFNSDVRGKAALLALKGHFVEVEKTMHKLRAASEYGKRFTVDLCNSHHSVNMVAIRAKTRTLGFGPFRSTCITELRSGNSAQLWNSITEFQRSVEKAGEKALRESGVGWDRVYKHSEFVYDGAINRCSLAHVVGFRVAGIWSVLGSVTQYPVNVRKEDWKRQYIEELLQPGLSGKDAIGNQKIVLPMFGRRELIVEDATTSLSTWGGIPASSIFSETVQLEDNPGISAALVLGRSWSQQAEDSTTISNIAIMLLSLCLALVPIALFADVSKLVALAYALVTGIVSCMPLLIKGIELIQLSGISLRATRSWVYGMEADTDISIAETWTARCQSHNVLFTTGTVFITIAVLTMITGLTLEILTRRKLQRNKRILRLDNLTSQNNMLNQMWAKEAPCDQCSCYAVQQETAAASAQVVQRLGSTGILSAQFRTRQ